MDEVIISVCEGYRTARSPDEMDSVGQGPCIVIGAIYRRKGYMLHNVVEGGGEESFLRPLLNDLKRDVKNLEDLSIYLGGGGFSPEDESRQETLDRREVILKILSDEGYDTCIKEVGWLEDPCSTQGLRLILSEGRAVYDELLDEDVIG